MAERGIDISGHASKVYVGLMQEPWDFLVTVCDDANERCVRSFPACRSGCTGPCRIPRGPPGATASGSRCSVVCAIGSRRG